MTTEKSEKDKARGTRVIWIIDSGIEVLGSSEKTG